MHVNLNSIASTFNDVEFFLVCIDPPSTVTFDGDDRSTLDVKTGKNYWSVTSIAPQSKQGLVTDTSAGSIMFRGYEADIGVHSYSDASIKEKLGDPSTLKNGVFAYIRIGCSGAPTLVKSDPLGVAPFYYRALKDGGYMFASHPPLLRIGEDGPNLTAWMSMIQNGFCYGDLTFYDDVNRVPAGIELSVLPGEMQARAWFDIKELPIGDRAIDDDAFENVEQAYSEGMNKLLALGESRTLPFSSGYDSRRFFATMMEKKVAFNAVTCQTFHRKKGRDYDIDSFFAPKIAAKFGVSCVLVSASPPDEYAKDSERRLSLIGTECFNHGWAVPFMAWLAKQPTSIVFDGLAGDTLGNSGYEFSGLHTSASEDVEILMRNTLDKSKFAQLSRKFPTIREFSARYKNHLESYPNNLNGAELAFLQGRTRRCISPWITMMQPPGQIIVFPYYDVRFVLETLKYHPAQKYKWFFQKECLKRSYPAYYDFPGSRNMPAEMEPLSKERSDALDLQAQKFVYDDKRVVWGALKYLALSNKVLLLLSTIYPPLRSRRSWLFVPLLLLVKTYQSQKAFVKRLT